MWLPQLLIVLTLLIIGFGLRRAFANPALRPASTKTALVVWFVLLAGGFLVWNLTARRPSVKPATSNVIHQSGRSLS
jgi:L-asparagine transporter-like permease